MQVSPLPIGPGGNNSAKIQMNATNTLLTMMAAQGNADKKFDPPVPSTLTSQVVTQGFRSGSYDVLTIPTIPKMVFIVGCLCIVYGIVARKAKV